MWTTSANVTRTFLTPEFASIESGAKRHHRPGRYSKGRRSGHITKAARALWYSSKLPQFLRCTSRRVSRRGKRRKPRKPSVEGELSFLRLAVAFCSFHPVVPFRCFRGVHRSAYIPDVSVVPAGCFRRGYFSHSPGEKVWSFRPAK